MTVEKNSTGQISGAQPNQPSQKGGEKEMQGKKKKQIQKKWKSKKQFGKLS